ncbi:MAG: efflux RND transporter periplasmic adaptor subunit [Actinomycetota bacterium]|nr:efflux RND transporter periplasmic adaptor subunit [Actinomycetota bacterium]
MTRWRLGAALVAALGFASAATVGAVGRGEAEDPSGREQADAATAVVTRRNLVARDTFEGSLGYVDKRSLTSSRSGTVTWLPHEGQTIRRGGVLYRVNDEPVVLLYGSYPLWRTLETGVEGKDVRQLEENVIALGYDPDGDIELDGEFDWATEAAVKRWQDDLGVTEDGSVETDQAVFLPGPRRVGELKTAVGSQLGAGTPVMDTSSTRRVVTLNLDARRQTLVRKGQSVQIELPNGRTVRGRIAEVGKVARTSEGGNGSPTITVTITVANARGTGGLDQAPVDVAIAREIRRDVLTVPVTALLALAGGGYAVEVVEGDTTKLVRVTPGLYADGLVEIDGEGVREGTKVVVPQ